MKKKLRETCPFSFDTFVELKFHHWMTLIYIIFYLTSAKKNYVFRVIVSITTLKKQQDGVLVKKYIFMPLKLIISFYFIDYCYVSSLTVANILCTHEEMTIDDRFSFVTRYKCNLFFPFYACICIAYQHDIKNPSLKVSFGSSFDF